MTEKFQEPQQAPLTTSADLSMTRGLIQAATLSVDPRLGQRAIAGAADVMYQIWDDAGVPQADILAHLSKIAEATDTSRPRPTRDVVNLVSTALDLMPIKAHKTRVCVLLNRGNRVVAPIEGL